MRTDFIYAHFFLALSTGNTLLPIALKIIMLFAIFDFSLNWVYY